MKPQPNLLNSLLNDCDTLSYRLGHKSSFERQIIWTLLNQVKNVEFSTEIDIFGVTKCT